MTLLDCPCGKPVRLGAIKITVNRKLGVSHYISHKDGSRCDNTNKWTCAMMKPYPRRDEDKPWFKMIAYWNDGAAP